jgi:hypothetical protein
MRGINSTYLEMVMYGELGIEIFQLGNGRNDALFKSQDGLDQTSQSTDRLQMADVGLDTPTEIIRSVSRKGRD